MIILLPFSPHNQTGRQRFVMIIIPPGRLERPHTAPEADALSTELRGHPLSGFSFQSEPDLQVDLMPDSQRNITCIRNESQGEDG